MSTIYKLAGVKLYRGDCREVLRGFKANSIDTVICDPPYGLEFMGREWDAPWRSDWQQGGGFSKPGIGERKTAWPSFSAMSRFGNTNPTCGKCGGRARGRKRCSCKSPSWKPIGKRRNPENEGLPNDMTSSGKSRQMAVYQEWCTAWAAELLRVCKPGAILLAFGGTRTWHRLACAIEDAGFEIRDCMMWLYGSGFPKSLDISKAIDKAAGAERGVVRVNHNGSGAHRIKLDNHGKGDTGIGYMDGSGKTFNVTAPATDAAKLWNGWGTALKPAWEPIIVAMKPLNGTFAQNAQEYGVAGLNIDGGRITYSGKTDSRTFGGKWRTDKAASGVYEGGYAGEPQTVSLAGRFPANLLLAEEVSGMLDEQSGVTKSGAMRREVNGYGGNSTTPFIRGRSGPSNQHGGTGGASRFFYCAKASKSERGDGNTHPTVKPLALMRYLCRLTKTPTGGTVLDCFMGSGTTAIAARAEGRKFIGIENNADYLKIARRRIAAGV